MDSFFLSKLIEGEAKGAKGCAPHSVQPRMPPSCSCTLLFVCPLCAQSREGVGHCLRVWVHAPVCLPPLHIHGDGAPLPCPCSLPFACCPCTQARGRGGRSFPVYAHPRLHVALCAKQREGGATSGFAPRLSAWRTNGEGPAPLPHTPCSRAASAQKPRQGVTSRNRSTNFSLFYPCLTFSLQLMVTHRLDSCDHLLYRLVTWYVLVSLLLS